MARKKQYIGIDLHHDNFVACYIDSADSERTETFKLNESDLNRFKSTLTKRDEIALEATSNAKFFMDYFSANITKIIAINPYEFRVIAQSAKKTDAFDAHKLAFFLKRDLLPEARIKPFAQSHILSLISTRQLFLKHKIALNRKTYGILIRHGIKVPKRRLEYKSGYDKYVFCHEFIEEVSFELQLIHEQIKHSFEAIEKTEQEIVDLSKELKGYEIMRSIPGMGKLNSAIILSCIVDIEHFSSAAKLASYFGITPRVRISNFAKNQAKISKKGTKIGRSALVQSTWMAIRYSDYLLNYYNKQKINKGATQKAIIATSNKYLKIIYNCLKNELLYDEYVKTLKKAV